MWQVIWSQKRDTSRVYPFVYVNALGGASFITWLTAHLANTYNWRYAYISMIVMILVCLLLALVFVENNKLHRYTRLVTGLGMGDFLAMCLFKGFDTAAARCLSG